jgi:hypothetical protein
MDSAERIYKELLHEVAATWYIADDFGEKVMVKAPSNAIKSLIAGCKMDFIFGKDTQHIFPIFHAGVRIYDDPVHYLRLTSVQRFRHEHKAIKKIMQMETVNIHFHNELTVCIATATLIIAKEDREKIISLLGDVEDLYSGDFNQHTTHSLNCFDYSIGKEHPTDSVKEIPIIIADGVLNDFIVMENIFVGMNERNHVVIDDKDEGGIFEKQIWVTLDRMFLDNLYRNPKITDKYGYRELTDVLAFHQYGIFLIETKALSVLDTTKERDMNRKVAGLQKQILKGIEQMKGAAKKVAANVEIFDSEGSLLHFDKSIVPHCIVLVSELFPFGEWKDIELKMMQAMIDQPMYLNVMDLRELMLYVGFAKGSKEQLDVSLMDRVEQFVKLQSIHMRIAGEKRES